MHEKKLLAIRRTMAALGIGLLLIASPLEQVQAQSDGPADVFTESAASKLLSQMAEGLQGHSTKKMLGAFDLLRMDAGPLFKEQITAFFSQYESIRVHFKLVEVKDDTAIVDAEMDATPSNGGDPPQHKSLQIRLSAGRTPAGWRFIDLQPRNFFS
jgi:hypothetical protein